MMSLLISTTILMATASSNAKCLAGVYDLGPEAAALAFQCGERDDEAKIAFCKRSVLLKRGYCTGQAQPVSCSWQSPVWRCNETGRYPFEATIESISENSIRYSFKSSFNSGERTGIRIDSP